MVSVAPVSDSVAAKLAAVAAPEAPCQRAAHGPAGHRKDEPGPTIVEARARQGGAPGATTHWAWELDMAGLNADVKLSAVRVNIRDLALDDDVRSHFGSRPYRLKLLDEPKKLVGVEW